MGTGRLAGHYFMMLGTFVVLGMIVTPILKDSLRIDLTFILHFWIGIGLLNARSGRRKLALVLNSLGILFCAVFLVRLIWVTGPVGSGRELTDPLLAAFTCGVIVVLLVPPLVLLLLPGTRRWFAEHRDSPPPRYALTGRVIALYVLAACGPIAGSIAIERSTRTLKPSSSCGTISYGERKSGFWAAEWMEDKATGRPLYVSWLAFAEANSCGSPHDGHVTFGPHRIAVPELKPVRYLFSPPNLETPDGNVMLVREDGKVIRLARRVTPDQLESAREAAQGVRDFEELQERLESLLK